MIFGIMGAMPDEVDQLCAKLENVTVEANNFDYAAVKAKGLQRTEGKEYVVNDGDVIEFLFNV